MSENIQWGIPTNRVGADCIEICKKFGHTTSCLVYKAAVKLGFIK